MPRKQGAATGVDGNPRDDEAFVAGGEAEIIETYLRPLTRGHRAARGLLDDCAVLAPPDGAEIVLTTDSLIEGVHFLPGDVPGFKALAVNVSDLVAKGADPLGYLLTLGLHNRPTKAFMRRLCEGLGAAQDAFGCVLLGGDTDLTPGSFTLTIAALGALPTGTAVSRSGARPGDRLVVTGTIGDATLGLALRQDQALSSRWELDDSEVRLLTQRYDAPVPHVAFAALLRSHASAALDVSDGLAKDASRMAAASGVGLNLQLACVPVSDAARRVITAGGSCIERLISGGEDYEVLAAVNPSQMDALTQGAAAAGIRLTDIGEVTEGEGLALTDAAGRTIELARLGWDHFDQG